MKGFFSVIVLALAASESVARMTSEQRCSACLYTYNAIDKIVTNQTSLFKGERLSAQKAAVREILSSVCDGPEFTNIGFANGRYKQVDESAYNADQLDTAPHHTEDLANTCRTLINQNEKKLISPLADFRRQSRVDLSRNLCSDWTDSCSFDYGKSKKKQKTKISKSNKCLVDALAFTTAGRYDEALEKVACAVVEMPVKEEESEAGGENASGDATTGTQDEDELKIEDE
jgi:hypothetical protein